MRALTASFMSSDAGEPLILSKFNPSASGESSRTPEVLRPDMAVGELEFWVGCRDANEAVVDHVMSNKFDGDTSVARELRVVGEEHITRRDDGSREVKRIRGTKSQVRSNVDGLVKNERS